MSVIPKLLQLLHPKYPFIWLSAWTGAGLLNRRLANYVAKHRPEEQFTGNAPDFQSKQVNWRPPDEAYFSTKKNTLYYGKGTPKWVAYYEYNRQVLPEGLKVGLFGAALGSGLLATVLGLAGKEKWHRRFTYAALGSMAPLLAENLIASVRAANRLRKQEELTPIQAAGLASGVVSQIGALGTSTTMTSLHLQGGTAG
jgi:hypothetical protein